MAMYVTKVWGIDLPIGPLVFSTKGWRENAVQKLTDGDRVILVGTKGEETPPEDRNRVLCMVEPSRAHVSSLDFFSPDRDPRNFKPDGTYRWPYGLLNRRAWAFAPGLFLDAVASPDGNRFGTAAAAGIVRLTDEEEARVLSHPHHEVKLLPSFHADRKVHGTDEARRRGAPPPTEGARRSVMHMRSAPAFVYWFQLVRTISARTERKIVAHKIGWAFEWERRLSQFNSIALESLGGLRYRKFVVQPLPTARIAFGAEQAILRRFDQQRHPQNREVLTRVGTEALQVVWEEITKAALLGSFTQ